MGAVAMWLGCHRGPPEAQVAGQTFVRCGQFDPPPPRAEKVGALTMRVTDRLLEIGAPPDLRVAAFSGPVGSALAEEDLAQLAGSGAQLALYLGGLGDSDAIALQNLTRLAALRLPTLFVAGGADRASIVRGAFEALDEPARAYVLHASGLREVRIGAQRFVVVAGAALGRYARDDQACGFSEDDLTQIGQALRAGGPERPWLLSWHAPAGRGVATGDGGIDVGSPELAAAFEVAGAISAFPEVAAARPSRDGHACVVRRLARTGTLRGDGSRLGAGLTLLTLSDGLVRAP